MLYITIPKGMTFKQTIPPNGQEIRDCFVDPQNQMTIINIQDIVKSVLQNKPKHVSSIQISPEITLYFRIPPNTLETFLTYEPNRNGKLSTAIIPQITTGKDAQKYNPASQTRYGGFWDQKMVLTPARLAEIQQARKVQSEDRRHTGDCPKPT